jgi:membrane fusion protein (multidrug efflux system)
MGDSTHQKVWWIATAFFLLLALGWGGYWLIWGQYTETTDDAYVNGNMITITPQEEGIVTTILADNTELVEAGQVLVQIDTHDYEIAFERAKADLADTVRSVCEMFIKVGELSAKKRVAEAELLRATLDYNHRLALVGDQSVSLEDFEHSETTRFAAEARLQEVGKELERAEAEVRHTTVINHPKVRQAKAGVRKAFLALHRCKVRAPTRGIVTQRRAQVGQWVRAFDPLMALIPVDQIWVDANFREVSLKNLRIGQPVKLIADMYGSEVKFQGKVVGLNPGTGSVFSILPPQNATGNWIKIVQRVPVKIELNPMEIELHPLVLGLSMTVTVDTHQREGLRLPRASPQEAVYASDVYTDELVGVEPIIDEIIEQNLYE